MKKKSRRVREVTFKAALKRLHIEDFGERIFHSNSHGELFHLLDYIEMATRLPPKKTHLFRPLFLQCVSFAEKTWSRPESCFQHMPRLLREVCEVLKDQKP